MESKLTKTLTFRVSQTEAEAIKAAASEEGRSLSNYVRRIVLRAADSRPAMA
jgi:uncharacterized protein (DUF1778 family)